MILKTLINKFNTLELFIKYSFFTCILSCFNTLVFPGNYNIKSNIIDSAKAVEFNQKYHLVLPIQDYRNMIKMKMLSSDSIRMQIKDTSYICISDVYNNKKNSLIIPRQSDGNGLSAVWMSILSFDSNGFLYFNNGKIDNYKYYSGIYETYNIGSQFMNEVDLHCIVNQGDSIFYYATTSDKNKIINGHETRITDFNFYEWNKKKNFTKFMFSASDIVPDSLLVPQLFGTDTSGLLYKSLDIYHWNWMELTAPSKLLINFAYCGFMQIDMITKSIEWYWGNNGSSFSKVQGIGNHLNPYYTHSVQKIETGPFKGCYSYFENGGTVSSSNQTIKDADTIRKPVLCRIFRIDMLNNSINIVFEKIFDAPEKSTISISSKALGSVNVMDNYILVNLGMIIPFNDLNRINISYGKDSAITFLQNWNYPNIYLYSFDGNEISNYTYPFGICSYTAMIKKRAPRKILYYNTFPKNKTPIIHFEKLNKEINISIIADKIEIKDSDGDFIMKANNTDKVNVGNLQAGKYSVNIYKGNSRMTKKFIQK